MVFIGGHPQVELTPVATDDKEVCEGDAFPLCRLPELLAGLAQRASKDDPRAGDGDLEFLLGGYEEAACRGSCRA